MRAALVLALACLVAVLGGCGEAPREGRASVALHDCRLPKLPQAARCATVPVPEDRARPGGRTIPLFVALLPANTARPSADPFVIVPGGPGQAASALAPFASRLSEIRRTRDVVLVDPRGAGRSGPLQCAAFEPTEDLIGLLETDPLPRAKACLDELAAQGVDVTQYTTANAVADLDAVREALGYERLNLWGGSYGTRVVLEYARRHAANVRTVVLDGVAPPELRTPVDVWATRERALDAAFARCRASPACAAAHPDPGAELDALLADLAEGRRAEVLDPRTGRPVEIDVTPDLVLGAILPLTYSAGLAALLPETVGRAAARDYAPLFAVAQLFEGSPAERVNPALHFAVVCAEDAPRVDADDLRTLERMRTASLARKVIAVCDAWPRGTAPVAFSVPSGDVPALVLSGALDPVTPPAYGERVARALANARHVVASGYAHVVSPHGCVPRLIAAFVADAGFDRLPGPCLEHLQSMRPPLPWPDRLGPPP